MKAVIIAFFLLSCVMVSSGSCQITPASAATGGAAIKVEQASGGVRTETTVDADSLKKDFTTFKAKYNKAYSSPEEESHRLGIYITNCFEARQLAERNPHATFGDSKFMDMSTEEFRQRYGTHKVDKTKPPRFGKKQDYYATATATSTFPPKFDWREKGAVNPIKNQGDCGDCYAFSVIGTIESQWFIGGHKLVALSEQYLTSCDRWDDGCGGGYQGNAFEWLAGNHQGAIPLMSAVPFQSLDGLSPPCSSSMIANSTDYGATITNWEDVPRDEPEMAAFMAARGPLSISADATTLQSYTGGIITDCVSEVLNHAPMLVGYDVTGPVPYWILRNSWGTDWGEEGYARILFGRNECLVKETPAIALVPGDEYSEGGA